MKPKIRIMVIFSKMIVQHRIVHLIRNSIKFVPTKDYKKITQGLMKVCGATNLKAVNTAFEIFCKEWNKYLEAVDVWRRNYAYVGQLHNYGSAQRKIIYTTNAIEAIKSSFEKVTKKGSKQNSIVQITVSESQGIREEMNNRIYSELVNGIEPIDGEGFIQRTDRQIHQVLEMAENEKRQVANFTCRFQYTL